MIRAVIFDMDGTMVNTEDMWKTINDKLSNHYGVTFDESIRVKMMGRKDSDGLALYKEYYNLSAPLEEIVATRREMVLGSLDKIEVKEGMYELLDLLDEVGIKKAVATSSFRAFAEKVLTEFDFYDRFDEIVTGDDVSISKPNPEIFLLTADKLGVTPDESLVLEDAQNGVEAAYNAAMKVFVIPHGHSNHHDFSKATKILSSMKEITKDELLSL